MGRAQVMGLELKLAVLGTGGALLLAVLLGAPMVGALLMILCFLTLVLSRGLGAVAWAVPGAKLAVLGAVTVLVPAFTGGDLIPVNPDQHLYLDTASKIAEALRLNPLAVDYAGVVGLHNRLYNAVLGWLAFLNGGGSVLLYRLFNVFLSMLLAGLAYASARVLYPTEEKTHSHLFLACALLPSVNAYAMFVLRDVLIGVLVMLVAFSLFGRRYWLTLLSLPLVYYTRRQLLFLLVGSCALYMAFRIARRLGRWGPAARAAAVVGFVIVGYFLAPRVLPPEYDYTHAQSLGSFGLFLARFPPSFVGFDFLLSPPQGLELERSTLALSRIILFDVWLVPLLFCGAVLAYRKMGTRWREFYLWTWALVLGYAAGYWISYGALMIRLWVPLYALLLVGALPLVERTVLGAQALIERGRRRPAGEEGR